MSFRQIPGAGLWVPNELSSATNPLTVASSPTIAATGDKFAWCGRVSFKERAGTKNIQTAGFRFGGVTKTGGSALSVSLQGVSATLGPPTQPDGVKGQTVAIANGNASFASNVWCQTGNFSSTRTVAHGDLVSVVIEFDVNGRLGSDSFFLSGLSAAAGGLTRLHGIGVNQTTGTWAAFLALPNVILGFDDGTFGTLYGYIPLSAVGSISVGSAAVPDEYALGFQLPFPAKICGFEALLGAAAGADFSIILYQGTTALQTVAVNSKQVAVQPNARLFYLSIPETALAANTLYRIAVRPDTTNQVSFYYFDVANAGHFQAHGGGMSWILYTRTDAGAWSAGTPTRRPFYQVELSAFDDAAQYQMAMIL